MMTYIDTAVIYVIRLAMLQLRAVQRWITGWMNGDHTAFPHSNELIRRINAKCGWQMCYESLRIALDNCSSNSDMSFVLTEGDSSTFAAQGKAREGEGEKAA